MRRLSPTAQACLAALACLAVQGCAAPPPNLIVLQDPVSGQIVPCGPTPDAPSVNPARDAALCAAAYERRGYRRLTLEAAAP
jgi:hypothetical protein